jgi:hypothetical protein
MNKRMVLAVGLVATLLTVGLVFGLTFVSSNHLTGTSLAKLVLSSNSTGVATYVGDTFVLVANLTNGQNGVLVTFYDNGSPIGIGTTTSGGIASISYVENNMVWDIHAEANY